ncbi:NEW3 domain-containing protein [Cohnella massiliensis]|uniref:COG1470 family protein n=1 Tax=Cohnella massiliensis TaxID=1816691 RepID=UPI0009BA1871|nr:NEW3 domain-containing protein [Cohnella massiliensis]
MIKAWKARTKRLTAAVLLLSLGLLAVSGPAFASSVYTPYTSLSAAPGETVSYSVDLINDSGSIMTADLSLDKGGTSWATELTAGGHPISQIAVKPGEQQTVNLSVTVPYEVNKGAYTFRLNAGSFGALSLKINVSEQGSYKSELTTDQVNMQGTSDSTFTYSLTLNNRTANKQNYALAAETPAGWSAVFSVNSNNVTAVEIEPNSSSSITLTVTPSESATAETYQIPVRATNNSTTAEATLEAVITGTYDLQLTTSDERLSTDLTAGGSRNLEMVVRNTGTSDLSDISLTATTPTDWEVTFEPKTIPALKAGESVPVTATIKSTDSSLAGDYVVGMTAQAAEKSSDATIRVTVETSVLWGWIGVLIILAVLAGIYGLFRKYGRR